MLLRTVGVTLLLAVGTVATPAAARMLPANDSGYPGREKVAPLRIVPRGLRGEPAMATVPEVTPVRLVSADPAHRCPKFEAAFARYGLKPIQVFSYIAYRESRCRIKAINILYDKNGKVKWSLNKNGTFDSGLMQINSGHAQTVRKVCGGGLDQLMFIDCNLRVARYLLDHGGLAHWGM